MNTLSVEACEAIEKARDKTNDQLIAETEELLDSSADAEGVARIGAWGHRKYVVQLLNALKQVQTDEVMEMVQNIKDNQAYLEALYGKGNKVVCDECGGSEQVWETVRIAQSRRGVGTFEAPCPTCQPKEIE